jgi:hypothetical protein
VSSCFIALIHIHDPARYEQYDEAFYRFQSEVIALEGNPRVFEGQW